MKKKLIIFAFVAVLLVMLSRRSESSVINSAEKLNFPVSQKIVSRVLTYSGYVSRASADYNIPISRIYSHIAVESGGVSEAVGSAGEIGLMQMMAAALSDVNKKYLVVAPLALVDLYEPGYAIAAGVAYLRILFDQLGSLDAASQAYNVGAANVGSEKAVLYLNKIKEYEKFF